MSPLSFLVFVCLLFATVSGQTEPTEQSEHIEGDVVPEEDPMIYFTPKDLIMIREHNIITVNWYTTLPGAYNVTYITMDEGVSKILNSTETFEEDFYGNYTGYGTFVVQTLFLGHNSFNLTIVDDNNNTLGSAELVATVILSYQGFNVAFTWSILVLTFVAFVNMGATLDLNVVAKNLKRPIGPAVGVICQYTIMPLASYGLAHLFFPGQPLLKLGMFLVGSSPGGGLSNIWTYLFKGSLDLSITMTLVSTIFAFAAVPFWVFTLGPTIFANTDFEIPFLNIVFLVLMLIIPAGIGVAINLRKPKIAKFITDHVLKKIALFNALFVITVGGYAYRYVFSMFTIMSLLASFLLPITGYICGFVIATLVRRPLDQKIAISIETGVQNAQIPILILKLSLGSPTGDLAIVVPAAVVILTPTTLFIIYIIKHLLVRLIKGKKVEITSDKKVAVANGKTNESFVQDKNEIPVMHIDSEKGYEAHENPTFVADGITNKVHSDVAEDTPDINENGNNLNRVENNGRKNSITKGNKTDESIKD